MKTSKEEAKVLLSRALTAIPGLTYLGVAIPEPKGMEGVQMDVAGMRRELDQHLDEIAICADWIKHLTPIRSIDFMLDSSVHSRRVEHWCRKRGTNERIANGSFIAAAVGLGYSFRVSGSNVQFNFSRKSLRQLRESVESGAV